MQAQVGSSMASSSRAPASIPEEDELADMSSFEYPMESLNSVTGVGLTMFTFDLDQRLIADRRAIKIGKLLGDGTNSIVYEGLYGMRPVAVKIIQPSKACEVTAERKEKFQREVILLSSMKHQAIVKFIGATYDPTMTVMTELMRGGSLQKYLWSLRPELLDLKLALTFALDISHAMEYLHSRGVIHRDLKPGNILLNKEKTRVKLADFGLAREISGEMTCEAGTYRWMAPEMFSMEPTHKRTKKYDHKVDVYSFSLILWELMTNATPFKGRNSVMVAYASAKSVRPGVEEVPKEIVPLLQSCWSEDPNSRPEFNAISEYLQTWYYSLYPPKVKAKQTPTSRVFDIENQGDDFDVVIDENNDENGVDEEEASPAEPEDEPREEVPSKKKKKKSAFVNCFTCSFIAD